MSQIACTMPEAKFRTVKKTRKSLRNSEFVYEARAFRGMSVKAVSAQAVKVSEPGQAAKAVAAIDASQAAEAAVSARRENKKEAGAAIVSWWPVAVAIFLTGFSPDWYAMAGQAGIWGLRAAFPLALLATHREIGLGGPLGDMLPHAALYLQIPLEGLLTKLTLDRGKSLLSATVQLVLVHLAATLVLFLLSFSGN
jgi:hypothetical protein